MWPVTCDIETSPTKEIITKFEVDMAISYQLMMLLLLTSYVTLTFKFLLLSCIKRYLINLCASLNDLRLSILEIWRPQCDCRGYNSSLCCAMPCDIMRCELGSETTRYLKFPILICLFTVQLVMINDINTYKIDINHHIKLISWTS